MKIKKIRKTKRTIHKLSKLLHKAVYRKDYVLATYLRDAINYLNDKIIELKN